MAEAAESKKEETKPSSGRWWEFYIVRYALGTIFGVLIVNMLVKSGLAIPFPEGSVSEITKPEGLPLLIGYGLAYCYLASSPILVFHSARFSLRISGFSLLPTAIMGFSGAVALGWALYARGRVDSKPLLVLGVLAIALIMYVVISQFRALIDTFGRMNELWAFYRKLDEKRRVKENRELVDSYRHLREHGNAFYVVCLELILGLGIYIAGKVSLFPPAVMVISDSKSTGITLSGFELTALIQTTVLLGVWIIPASFVWAIGCSLEKEFANDSSLLPATANLNPGVPCSSATEAMQTPAAPTGTP